MKIAILTMGTQGDVQPYAILGQALQRLGHQVTLSTAKNFEELVKSYHLNFVPVEADFQEFMNSEEGKRMMKNPFRARKNLKNWVYPMIHNSLQTFYQLAKDSDRVVYHIKTMADYFSDQFPEKMMLANVVPAFQETKEFSNPVFSALPLPAFLNKWTYKLSDLGIRMMMPPVHQFRKEVGLPIKFIRPALPSLYGISEYFLAKPQDYPVNSHFTGFWTSSSSLELEIEVLNFLEQGEPPLLITFGSMIFDTRMDLSSAISQLADELQVRVMVVQGWGLKNIQKLEKNPAIKVITSAPYDKLFPHVKAVIHHGGIGTISACLLAGKPFFTCPVLYPLGDQHFWGAIAYKKGIALKPVALKNMTKDILLLKAKELLSTKSLYFKIEKLSELIKNENGVEKAIELIDKNDR